MDKELVFTAHNMKLADGSYTMGENLATLSNRPEMTAMIKFLKDFLKVPERSTIVDLGCLEGGYALEFARAGYHATGIEIRESNIACCNYVQKKSGLSDQNLRFVQDDVRNLPKHGKFDVTFCAGLLYHLEEPAAFLKAVAQNTNQVLILHTHFSRLHDPQYDSRFLRLMMKIVRKLTGKRDRINRDLSPLTTNEDVRGRWFAEFAPDASKGVQESLRWASWKNHRSFWIAKEDLVGTLRAAGFKHVFEMYDYIGAKPGEVGTGDSLEKNDWGLFVATK